MASRVRSGRLGVGGLGKRLLGTGASRKWRLLGLAAALVGALAFSVFWMTSMPGKSHRGAPPPLGEQDRQVAIALRHDVEALAGKVGERNTTRPHTLDRTWGQLELGLEDANYKIKHLPYRAEGQDVSNIEATLEGKSRSREIVVVGAHYDSARGSPGADDNASGVAVLLWLARAFEPRPQARTIRFVAFVNEEPPHFQTPGMGSLVYAKACKERGDDIVAMLSLESLGYYRDEPGSQKYPPVVGWFYPNRGDFVAFIGNVSSRSLVRDAVGAFRARTPFPSEGAAMPSFVEGVGWSDQWSFWQVGYPAIMVTDTAPFRNPNYHTANDKPETLDYDRLARVTEGIEAVLMELAR